MGFLARLKAFRADLILPKVEEYGGRIVKTTGDGTLIEFPSVVDAVQHAVDVQQEMAHRSAGEPQSRRMQFRIGINVGDVIIDGDDIHGDGVNIAARLEGLAEPGGICISGAVHEHIRNKLDLDCEDLGAQSVKNIVTPVRVYRVRLEGSGAASKPDAPAQRQPSSRRIRPSIAVLPFVNLSGDPEQEYFADGIAEDIITALARFRWFFVTARNASFSYKGQSPDIRNVSEELGVRYVLEGSVRKAGNRVRITAQLIDGETGNHLWAEKFDRDLDDIFAVQDAITRTVVGAIEPELGKAERERSKARRPDSMDAWDLYQQGTAYLYRRTKEGLTEAIGHYDKAIDSDPNFAQAHSMRTYTFYLRVLLGFSDTIAEDRLNAMRSAQRAVTLDADDPMAHTALGMARFVAADSVGAASALERALDLNSGSAIAHSILGMALTFLDRLDEAITHHHVALDVGARDPALPFLMGRLGMTCLRAGRLDDALKWSEKAVQSSDGIWLPLAQIAWIYVELGRRDEAREIVDTMIRNNPGLGAAYVQEIVSIWNPDPAEAGRWVDNLRAVGLPE